MTAQHTPGPWHVNTSGVIVDVRHVVDGRERIVARISTRDTMEKSADEVADAQLIAEAPELLTLLQEIVDRGLSMTRIDKARAAIARATQKEQT